MPYDPVLERLKKLEKVGSKRSKLTDLDRITIGQALERIEFGFDEDGSSKRNLKKWRKGFDAKRWKEILIECNKRANSEDVMKSFNLSGMVKTS